MSRRASRLAAVEVLYGADLRGVAPSEVLDDRADADPYTRHLVGEVASRREELDGLIAASAIGWRTERMSPVDLNVLRVGVLEILEGDVPPASAIDEAVEVAKRFSGRDAGRFVNGVLEAVRQTLSGGGGGAAGGDDGAGGGGGGADGVGGKGAEGGPAGEVAGAGSEGSGDGDRRDSR